MAKKFHPPFTLETLQKKTLSQSGLSYLET